MIEKDLCVYRHVQYDNIFLEVVYFRIIDMQSYSPDLFRLCSFNTSTLYSVQYVCTTDF